ncbi:MAG: dioxygenase [Fibrobacteres bacterium]|nr:dioxygenase [Fibrobacterota bacterium]
MDRRTFVGAGAAALAALALPKSLRGQACANITVKDRYGLGPFYTPNAPMRLKLAQDAEPGQRIAIQGTVSDCSGPVAGVGLDVWQATDSGCYKHPSDVCPDIPGHPDEFRLRGRMVTDAKGGYAFESILPGAYLNGSAYRPRHIHVIITPPTSGTVDTSITTQLYFEGDPYIKGDYGADEPGAANRIIPLAKTVPSLWQGTWNIFIPSPATGFHSPNDPSLAEFDVYARREGGRIVFHLPPNTSHQPVELRLYSASGVLVKRSLQTDFPVQLDVAALHSGAYVAELAWWTRHGLRKESVPVRL